MAGFGIRKSRFLKKRNTGPGREQRGKTKQYIKTSDRDALIIV